MLDWLKKKKLREIEIAIDRHVEAEQGALSRSLDENIKKMAALFEHVDTLVTRRFQSASGPEYYIAYSDGLVDGVVINDYIIKPLLLTGAVDPYGDVLRQVMDQTVMVNDVKKTDRFTEIIQAVTYGDTVLFIQGCSFALLLNSKGFETRSISEPEGEKVLVGPREGFCEAIMLNLSLVRRRLRTSDLKMRFQSLGTRTGTQVCVCYMDSLVDKGILDDLRKKLDKIEIDGILDSNYITEFIAPPSLLGFARTGYTERPDSVVAKLLEGRIALFVDGTPMVLTLPYLFIENFQSGEDYFIGSYYASFSRMMRIIAAALTILIPAFYIAAVTYHHEIMPNDLMIHIASEQRNVPLPAALEAFLMILVFDILRETGVRMPTYIGQALGIVGALVIGQAAVEAGLVSAPMIIVVAVTGITSLLVPKLSSAATVLRFAMLIAAANMGMLGLVAGTCILVIHILNLQSFGVPQVSGMSRISYQELKDTFFRAAWPHMRTRPPELTDNLVRMKVYDAGDGKEKEGERNES